MQKKWVRRLWLIPPLLIALLILMIGPKLKSPPQKVDVVERATKVRVIKTSKMAIVPKAIGYGSAEAARTWEAVAEVSGQVAWLSEELKAGKIIAQGMELLHIDDSSYQLALTQTSAQLNTLTVKDKTTNASLKLEEQSQLLLRKDIERKRKLKKQGTLSASVLDEAERALLKGEVSVQNLKNSLAINAAERELLNVQKSNAELDIKRTRFIAPFDIRITNLKVTQAQYASKGQLLFSADGLDKVEIQAHFPIGKLRPLIARENQTDTSPIKRTPGALELSALVRLRTATHTVEWGARVDRVAGVVNPQTQTIGVVVVVDNPYKQAQPGHRPPLVRNTFVEVELHRKLQHEPITIPTSALHDDKVYLVDQKSRLKIQPVKTLFIQGSVAAIAKGLKENETLVVSDLIAATNEMLLDPVSDEKTMKRLKMEATGQTGHTK